MDLRVQLGNCLTEPRRLYAEPSRSSHLRILASVTVSSRKVRLTRVSGSLIQLQKSVDLLQGRKLSNCIWTNCGIWTSFCYDRSVILTAGNLNEGEEERNDLWLLTGGLDGTTPIARYNKNYISDCGNQTELNICLFQSWSIWWNPMATRSHKKNSSWSLSSLFGKIRIV